MTKPLAKARLLACLCGCVGVLLVLYGWNGKILGGACDGGGGGGGGVYYSSCVYDAYLKPSSTVAAASGSIIAPRMS